MLNSDKTIYGRFGDQISSHGMGRRCFLKRACRSITGCPRSACQLSRQQGLVGRKKTGPKPLFERPELFPSLREKYSSSLNYSGDVVKSCIHCHQIGDAGSRTYRSQNKPIPDEILNPYPHPKALGLILDPTYARRSSDVVPGSLSFDAGFRPADVIIKPNGQPILSVADVQWVLNGIPTPAASLRPEITRDGVQRSRSYPLPAGEILMTSRGESAAWGLRRMVTGGLVFEPASSEERAEAGIASDRMLPESKHVGMGMVPGMQRQKCWVSKDDPIVFMTVGLT